jgi:ATP-dependent DNA helicase RecG
MDKLSEIYESIRRAINNGEKIYWICPLIEESDELEFSNVLEKFELFSKLFGKNKVALIHGKLKGKEKDEIMLKFSAKNSEARVLIATTVIEVGIDIKDATIMVIENSEKFGLSQLHQLRGRVGRSDQKSYCLLLYSQNTSFTAKKRLEIMRDCFDGFEVAEEDLKIRGAGQIFGTRQSGLPEYKFANLAMHSDLLKIANKNAQVILAKNPNLEGDAGKNIKNLLSIFKYDNFIKLVKSG